MEKSKVMGHIFAIITILVWGSCFVLTKNLLVDFTPIQIIPLRMGLAYGSPEAVELADALGYDIVWQKRRKYDQQ